GGISAISGRRNNSANAWADGSPLRARRIIPPSRNCLVRKDELRMWRLVVFVTEASIESLSKNASERCSAKQSGQKEHRHPFWGYHGQHSFRIACRDQAELDIVALHGRPPKMFKYLFPKPCVP